MLIGLPQVSVIIKQVPLAKLTENKIVCLIGCNSCRHDTLSLFSVFRQILVL